MEHLIVSHPPLLTFESYPPGAHPSCCCSWPQDRSPYLGTLAVFWVMLTCTVYATYKFLRPKKVDKDQRGEELPKEEEREKYLEDLLYFYDDVIQSYRKASEDLVHFKTVSSSNRSALFRAEERLSGLIAELR
uniref:RIC3 domain-containing protein n=1 Tax=Steinernema glaseri TaxID=37863 RepID=A0A1I8A7V3_9BILA